MADNRGNKMLIFLPDPRTYKNEKPSRGNTVVIDNPDVYKIACKLIKAFNDEDVRISILEKLITKDEYLKTLN